MPEQFVEMELREIQIVDNPERSQVIVLGERDGQRAFPIFIGFAEAIALDAAVHGRVSPRPQTHDLILNALADLGATLQRTLVVKLENDTYYGALEVVNAAGETILIDSRPSDAIVLAAKTGIPVMVAEQVLQDVERSMQGMPEIEEEEPGDAGPDDLEDELE